MSEKRALKFLRGIAPWALIGVGAVVALLGFLARTTWAPDPFWTASLEPGGDTRLIISDPGMLDLLADEVKISATVVAGEDLSVEADDPDAPEDSDESEPAEDVDAAEDAGVEQGAAESEDLGPNVVISIARDVDAQGWIENSAAARITGLDSRTRLSSQGIEGELESALSTDSDLWWHSASGTDSAELDWRKEPGRWSVVIASSADKQISKVELTWPQDTATPLALPLLLAGGLLILAGAVVLALPQAALYLRRQKPESELEVADLEVAEEAAGQEPALGEDELLLDAPEPDVSEPGALAAEEQPDETPPMEAAPEDETDAAPSQITADPTPQPVARFTPGTMTRRQIRELEQARRLEALAAEESEQENTNPDREENPPDADVGDEKLRFSSRSEQWRKTWGVAEAESEPDRISGWLPREVEEEEDSDD